MTRRTSFGLPLSRRHRSWPWLPACIALLVALAGCGTRPAQHARTEYNPSRYYPPPGSAGDPWGPYIHEASGRFGVPELWIRRVMRQESGGQEDVISWAGAMGLMQVMPDTYDGLRTRYNLGNDPFDPHNNILAGTAYLREMYDRFGAPGFLAAYNAGPNRLDSYLNNGRPLPDETVNYVASIAPLLGPETPMSGPLAVYAGPMTQLAAATTPSGCDPDAAYNPNGQCTPMPVQRVVIATASPPTAVGSYNMPECDPDAAYDPTRPCQSLPAPAETPVVTAAYYAPASAPVAARFADPCNADDAYDPAHRCQPSPSAPVHPPVVVQDLPQPSSTRRTNFAVAARPIQETMTTRVAFTAGPPPGPLVAPRWAIQVGAFASLAAAEAAAQNARSTLPDILRTAKIELPPTTPLGAQVAFRARLFGLSAQASAEACERLTGRGIPCITVPPTRDQS